MRKSTANVQHYSFNYRVAAVMRRADGAVLLCQFKGCPFWMLPGGRVEPGEPAREALARELQEELGSTVPRIGACLGSIENLFSAGGRRLHEIGLHFEVEAGGAPPADEFQGAEPELMLRWSAPGALEAMDLRPPLLKSLLAKAHNEPFGYRCVRDEPPVAVG